MSSGRLQQQFIRLWQCCDGKSQETTLNALAEMLSCSRRHMRTLLNMMEARGWLTWEAEAGRGKRSRLTFLYTGLALQQHGAEVAQVGHSRLTRRTLAARRDERQHDVVADLEVGDSLTDLGHDARDLVAEHSG